jgi:hypothetical protein
MFERRGVLDTTGAPLHTLSRSTSDLAREPPFHHSERAPEMPRIGRDFVKNHREGRFTGGIEAA